MAYPNRSRPVSSLVPKIVDCLKEYSWGVFRSDLIAGLTVGLVSLPLAMAFAMASGVDPAAGIFTSIIAGFLISALGGSSVQIGGPTGAFVVIILDIVQKRGYDGLVLATIMAGIFLIIMALLRVGSWIKFIPYPLITGFTAGIAVVIFFSQLKNFFGYVPQEFPGFFGSLKAVLSGIGALDPTTTAVAVLTFLVIVIIRRFFPVIPWGIASIVLSTLVVFIFDLPVQTILSQYGEIPKSLPSPRLPNFLNQNLFELIPDSFVIAFLAGVESLLCAIVADGMIGKRHRSNAELLAQGIANIAAVFFGGISATGAVARTATNIKAGAKTPIAGIIHSITLLIVMAFFSRLVGLIPIPALAAVLVMIAYNMSEIHTFRRLLKAPSGDVFVLLTTFFLTIFVDLTVGVGVGLILSSFIFMKRMSESPIQFLSKAIVSEDRFEEEDPDAISKKQVPKGVEVYEVTGPFFFGVADHLQDVLMNLEKPPEIFILRMRKVPVIDGSGLHALREFFLRCQKAGTICILSGVGHSIEQALKKFGLVEQIGAANICKNIDLALKRADLLKSEIQ